MPYGTGHALWVDSFEAPALTRVQRAAEAVLTEPSLSKVGEPRLLLFQLTRRVPRPRP
jgi:hypothetical protein